MKYDTLASSRSYECHIPCSQYNTVNCDPVLGQVELFHYAVNSQTLHWSYAAENVIGEENSSNSKYCYNNTSDCWYVSFAFKVTGFANQPPNDRYKKAKFFIR